MQLGMIGLGRMGANMVERLMKAGHDLVVYDTHADAVTRLVGLGATGAGKHEGFRRQARQAARRLADGSGRGRRSHPGRDRGAARARRYRDRRRKLLLSRRHPPRGGTEGQGAALRRRRRQRRRMGQGARLLSHDRRRGRRSSSVSTRSSARLRPASRSRRRTAGATGEPDQAELGYLHCGPNGAGHFVKMVHNGIEYGLMAAYAEGMNMLRHANVGAEEAGGGRGDDAAAPSRTLPVRHRRGARGRGLAARQRGRLVAARPDRVCACAPTPTSARFAGRVSDSGEGRWTLEAAIDEGVPAPVLSAALFGRFESRGAAEYADKLMSAMRFEFGGHHEKPAGS